MCQDFCCHWKLLFAGLPWYADVDENSRKLRRVILNKSGDKRHVDCFLEYAMAGPMLEINKPIAIEQKDFFEF